MVQVPWGCDLETAEKDLCKNITIITRILSSVSINQFQQWVHLSYRKIEFVGGSIFKNSKSVKTYK